MSTSTRWPSATVATIPPVVATVLVLACADAGPAGPTTERFEHAEAAERLERTGATERSAQLPIDVSGDWEWRREEKFTIPDEFAFVFGIQPEGPMTHFDCDVEGVIALVQTGSALSGTEMETWSSCETRGGQVFSQPGLGVLIPIAEGRVTNRTVELVVGDAEVICPIHARVTEVESGVAQSLVGTGRCWVPGHPKSNAPEGSPLDLDPPTAGTEKIVVWEAVRPAD